ncbi:hypothetical protein [Ornithinimicrobium cryptoxanthini]|uniref:Uncharacterized protein n=1 Tax=Ornithinimicrobium cryptoxanthini TaxID=2934161 RepID=A0ABY4YIS3_9MICO|nr:hypothetical protein [Ornithinimicrobium cryptoxanthini]USQ76062.1 hypothetical protein NF557_15935 [Ornithinimicrobium cryptoxanthini]
MLEVALKALLREHREAEVDRADVRAYGEQPVELPDEWGDVASFLDAAGKL